MTELEIELIEARKRLIEAAIYVCDLATELAKVEV